jgi:carboxymethylenebutenolidase
LGTPLSLTASDGFHLGAYRADPSGASQGGVVVVQEIFGLNHHIRAVCDRLAAAGFSAVAPALFDRQQRDFQSGYTPDEVTTARKFVASPDIAAFLRDTQAAVDLLKASGPVSVIGFCLGGSVAFLSATRFEGIASAVCFYGGMIAKFADEKPKCPTQMHFGEKDEHIPMTDVAAIRAKRPECDIHVYPAGHGFYCDERPSYHQPSAALAWDRTLAWLRRGAKK